MDDRELLEMAAKAAGLIVVYQAWEIIDPFCEGADFWLGDDEWNPLTDDGDALRLAVKLNMLCDFGPSGVYIQASRGVCSAHSDYRRAIVRAAAEIGRSMP